VINSDKKLIRFKDESIKTKKKKMKYSLTTYTIQLIRFYNCFIRLFKFIWLNILFFYTLFELIKIPFYFLFSSLSTNLNYNNNNTDDDCDLNANKKDNKLIKPKRNFFDRTLLNNLIRKSNNKKFVLKYFDDYIDDDHDKIRIKNKSNYKFSVENENNVILVNEVKSNTSVSFDSLNDMNKIEKTFLTLDNCKEINLNNDGNKKKLKS
jgi:hypothetical protein